MIRSITKHFEQNTQYPGEKIGQRLRRDTARRAINNFCVVSLSGKRFALIPFILIGSSDSKQSQLIPTRDDPSEAGKLYSTVRHTEFPPST